MNEPNTEPLVSVVMGAYNCMEFVGHAIESILNQTYRNIEFIIIDDCSTDSTFDIIKGYAERDARVKVVRNETNRGLGYSLNLGMSLAKGKFVARMDADDISKPHRLEEQVKFLNKNPEVACVGTSAERFGDISLTGRIFKVIHAKKTIGEIRVWLLIGTPMFHPSVMFNKSIMEKLGMNYDPEFRRAQDYELWSRLAFSAPMANIDKPLHCYRYHKSMASNIASEEQRRRSSVMQKRVLEKLLGRCPSADEMKSHSLLAFGQTLASEEIEQLEQWMETCFSSASGNVMFDKNALWQMLTDRRVCILRNSISNRIKRLKHFFNKTSFYSYNPVTVLKLLK